MEVASCLAQGSRLKAQGKEFIAFSLQPRAYGGFTFVELMIAATMIAVLFVGLGAHLRGGIDVWRRATQTSETLQEQRIALDRLERDLANAIVYYPKKDEYSESEKGKLSLPVFGAHELQLFTVVPGIRGDPASVRFVTYACKEESSATGLWRSSQSIGEARYRLPAQEELALPGCSELSVHYAYKTSPGSSSEPLIWDDNWGDDSSELKLPRLIKVSLVISGATVERTILIPQGELAEKSPTT